MKKIMIVLVSIILIFFVVKLYQSNTKINSSSTETLTQIEIVQTLEEKGYLLTKFQIPYDEYRETYIKYFRDGEDIDENFLYMNVISDDIEHVPMGDFIGKDIDETKEYLLSIGYPLDSVEDKMEKLETTHEMMISDIYQDNYNENWSYVFVRHIEQGETNKCISTSKYHFKLKDNVYEIVNKAQDSVIFFTNDDLETLTQEQIDSRIESGPYRYINNEPVEYTKTIDLKKLIDK